MALASSDHPLVTWLLPVKNGMPHLTDALASIAAQTYKHFTILAWDNGSSDGTVDELLRWIPHRLPGRVVLDRPLPLGESRACMVKLASSDICAWIDADDVNESDRLHLQVAYLVSHASVAAVGGQVKVIDENGTSIGRHGSFPTDHSNIIRDMLSGPALAQPAVLFRRSAVLEVGNYRNVGPVNVEDYDLWLRLAQSHRLANLPEPLLRYRIHERSSTVISKRAGVLRSAAMERFATHGPALFGCSKLDAALLASGKHPFAFPVFLKIARHLDQKHDIPLFGTLRSRRFLQGARQMTAAGDWRTHVALTALNFRPLHFLQHIIGRLGKVSHSTAAKGLRHPDRS